MDEKLFILRIGSNAEKTYIYKTVPFFNSVIAKANLFESSKGLLSSLFIKLNIQKGNSSFIIDPNTYVFALNPMNDWSIRSWVKCKRENADQKIIENLKLSSDENPNDSIREIENPNEKDKNKVEIYAIKRAYRKLADIFFNEPLSNTIGKRAINPNDFNQQEVIDQFVINVSNYQKNALIKKYSSEKYKDFQLGITEPKFILSPYFLIKNDEWFQFMVKIWNSFDEINSNEKSSLVLLIDKDYLNSKIQDIIDVLSKYKSQNVFIWVSNFKEDTADEETLSNYTKFVVELNNQGKHIIDLYSGGYSTFLIPFGIGGVTNGTGYGMDRDVEPVQGGVPTAQYYIPTLHLRQQVLESFNLIVQNNIELDKSTFHAKICNCPICQEGIKNEATDMLQFFGELGEARLLKNGNIRRYPTSKSLERCNFHFVLSRLIEYRWSLKATKDDVLERINEEKAIWHKTNKHLERWYNTLTKFK